MKKRIILLLPVCVLLACNSPLLNQDRRLETNLLGRWEAVEAVFTSASGEETSMTFGEDGDFQAAYSIGLDYSSGFDLLEENVLDLIWYSANKEQYFHWEVEDRKLRIDSGKLVFDILEVEENWIEIVQHGENESNWWRMERLD